MIELVIGFAAGYAASIYTWPWLRALATGAKAEIGRLEDRIDKIKDALK